MCSSDLTVATEFSLATNNYYRDRDGNKQERTDWHRVKAYGKLAELFDQYLERGRQISIVGSMQYRKWVDKHDQTRNTAEVIADSFSFIGGQNRQSNNHNYDHINSVVADPLPTELSARTEARRVKTAALTAEEHVLAEAHDGLPFQEHNWE